MQNIQDYVCRTAPTVKQASYIVAAAETAQRNTVLLRTAELIEHHQTAILVVNTQDMGQATQKDLSNALLDRLRLTGKTINAMCEGLCQTIAPLDTAGEMDKFRICENGLQIGKMRIPLDVAGVTHESRPNVTTDVAALCLKSGNACVLRGNSEVFNSNMTLSKSITQALVESGLLAAAVSLTESTDREGIGAVLRSPEFIDVAIPRGGKSLVSRIAAEARVPVIRHLDGICHIYIDRAADTEKTVNIVFNAKTSRYGACNTMETLFVHQSRVAETLPVLAEKYVARDVEPHGYSYALSILPRVQTASKEDQNTEYFVPILPTKIADNLEEVVAHINTHGSHHTNRIVTESYTDACTFLRTVDSASVMVNAFTCFADGFGYGFGAKIGISVNKTHIRGPAGLHRLTSQRWIVLDGRQVRE